MRAGKLFHSTIEYQGREEWDSDRLLADLD